jgi:DNA-binding transcriptional regulator GbsR (MarR family)
MSTLTPVEEKFILHWGEMGSRWGINRTVAQIHALLFAARQPLTAEEISEALSVARSNVSTSLRELQNWGIIRVVHVMGDRRDHFECMADVWEMFRLIVHERKRREVDPTLMVLRDCIADLEKVKGPEAHTRQRLVELLEFFEAMTSWYETLNRMPTPVLGRFVKMGDKALKLVGGAGE